MNDEMMKKYGKLIYILIGVLALVISYLFGYTKLLSNNTDTKDEIDTLQTKYDSLRSQYDKKDTYLADTETAKKDYEDMLKKFDAGVTDESLVVDVEKFEADLGVKITDLTIKSKAATDIAAPAATDDAAVATDIATYYQFGQMQSLNPDDNGSLAGADSSFKGVNATYTMTAVGTYKQIQDLLETLKKSNKRKVASSITFSYDASTEMVTCTFDITEYAITGDDRKMSDINIQKSSEGQGNIFFSQLYAQANATTE